MMREVDGWNNKHTKGRKKLNLSRMREEEKIVMKSRGEEEEVWREKTKGELKHKINDT